MTLPLYLLFAAGLALLLGGAELLVRGASRLAAAFGISPLVVGLTVVAFGTSSPEIAVSVHSALAGQPEVALGNVVGSNVFNILFVLGISALITPLTVAQQLVRFDVPLLIGLSTAVALLSIDGLLGSFDGALLVAGLLAYIVLSVRWSRRETAEVREEYRQEFGAPSAGRWLLDGGLVVVGLALLVVGARWFLEAAIGVARALGVSELVIGLTVVAIGTSLPEIATSVLAALRGERDIAVGNAIGSNLFNLLGVLGIAALAGGGLAVPRAVLRFDFPVMIAVAVACLPIFWTGGRISRWEGGLFLVYWAAYTAYLLLDAAGHDALPTVRSAMSWFVLPLTGVTLLLLALRERSAAPPDQPG